MEQKPKDEVGVTTTTTNVDNPSSTKSSVLAKRSPRMVYESSFATSFASVRSQKRPPGFLLSSLDYRSSGTRSAGPPPVTTKPGRNSKHYRQQQQQGTSDSDQQRYYRSGQSQPTRAQGNFGPPPHSVKTLDDLENMSEEQIYKLFMDDPELYEKFIKTTEKGSSTRDGSRKSRRSTAKKPSNNTKTRRNTTKSRTLKSEPFDREVPYFQWLFVLILIGILFYQCRKMFSVPPTTKERNNVTTKKGKGGKQKIKKVVKFEKKIVSKTKEVSRDKLQSSLTLEKKKDTGNKNKSVGKLSSKNKKKASKSKSKSIDKDRVDKIQPTKESQDQKPDIESGGSSSKDNEPQIPSQIDSVVLPYATTITSTDDENDQDWQTVTKSSRGAKKEKMPASTSLPDVVEEEKVILEVTTESTEDGAETSTDSNTNQQDLDEKVSNDESGIAMKKKTTDPSSKDMKSEVVESNTAGKADESNCSITKDEKVPEVTSSEKSVSTNKGESGGTTEDDAALALQLHKEEVNLARDTVGNPQEEEWEEVQVRRKRA